MAKSRIEWTEEVWNPLTGCTRIGQGCKNCYAERMEIDHWLAQMEPNGTIPVMTPPIHTGDGGWHEYQPCPGSWFMAKVGKKESGRELDGQTWDEYPDWDEPRRRVTNIPSDSVSV